jgi:hypothetical protein
VTPRGKCRYQAVNLGAVARGGETLYLSATVHDGELGVHFLNLPKKKDPLVRIFRKRKEKKQKKQEEEVALPGCCRSPASSSSPAAEIVSNYLRGSCN